MPTVLDTTLVRTPEVCGGRLHIDGTRMTVNQIVTLHKEGLTVQQIVERYPQRTLSEIYTVLAWYYAHQAEFDRELAEERGGRGAGTTGSRCVEAAMSRIRFYVDEDAAEHAVVDGLRRRGLDVLTVLEAGRGEETDEEQLAFAARDGRVLYTLNVEHFCRLHREFLSAGKDHAGIVVIPRQRYSIGEKIQRLLSLAEAITAEEMKNRLEYL